MYLALQGLYRPRWTDLIHAEWMRSVRRDYPDITAEHVERIRDLMNAHVADCLVEGFETLVSTVNLPDADDRHVLAAAIRSGAEVIVTANLADFPDVELARHGVAAEHPDQFVMGLIADSPLGVFEAARQHRRSLKNPPLSVDAYLAALRRQSLIETVATLSRHSELL